MFEILIFVLEILAIVFALALPLYGLSKENPKSYGFVSLSLALVVLVREMQKYANFITVDDLAAVLDILPSMRMMYFIFIAMIIGLNVLFLIRHRTKISFKELFVFMTSLIFMIVLVFNLTHYNRLIDQENYALLKTVLAAMMPTYYISFFAVLVMNSIVLCTQKKKVED